MAYEIILPLITLVISLGIMATAARYVITQAVRLSHFFRISEVAIGFILLAVITSIPELSVAVISFSGGQNSLSLGDILGSQVANIALTLGICGIIGLKFLNKEEIKTSTVLIILSLVAIVFIMDGYLGYTDALILLILFVFFIYYSSRCCIPINTKIRIRRKTALKAFIIVLAGMALVIISAGFVVRSATQLVALVGLAESFIGATIIALGTSLPELAVDVAAIMKRRFKLVIGETIGSCVTNVTLVLGIGTLISPFQPNMSIIWFLIGFIFLSSIFLMFLLWKSRKISKAGGAVLLTIYVVYLLWLSGIQLL